MNPERKKTKILAVGDVHGDSRLIKKLAAQAKKENVDMVILAGDLVFDENYTKNIVGPFVKAKKPVLLIHGNHESLATVDFLAQSYPDTKNLHGYSFVKNGIGIFGAGGVEDMPGFPGVTTEKELFKALGKAHSGLTGLDKKIMVTHMHPAGTKSEFSGFEGSEAITNAIKKFKPDLALCAHIHEASGVEDKIGKTRVVNVSRKGKIFEI